MIPILFKRALLMGAAFFASALLAAPRVAVLNFERAGAAGSLEPALADFSQAVQVRLLAEPKYSWVERAELERIMQEAARTGLGAGDPATAVRLGSWARADLLVRGEIAADGRMLLEVIDLKHADLLAAGQSHVTIGPDIRLNPSAEETSAAVTAILEILAKAAKAETERAGRQFLAPLYFKNVSATERLDYVQGRLAEALETQAPAAGFQTLRFSRTDPARGESELVLGGLTDQDPDAWQHVADAYVWGTIEEKGTDGQAFEIVPVELVLQAWTGTRVVQEARWSGPVSDLAQGISVVTARTLQNVQGMPREAKRDPQERDRVAAALSQRATEVRSRIQTAQRATPVSGTSRVDYLRSAAGRQQLLYYRQLMELVVFLKPLDKGLQASVQANRSPMGVEATSVSALLKRIRQTRVKEHRPDGSMDEASVVRLASDLQNLRRALPDVFTPRWYKDGPLLTTAQLRAVQAEADALWEGETKRVLSLRRNAPEPHAPGLATAATTYARDLPDFLRPMDTVRARSLLEELWPDVKEDFGRMLHQQKPFTAQDSENAVTCVLGMYDSFGDIERGIGMLNEAWTAVAPQPVASGPASSAKPTPVGSASATVSDSWGPAAPRNVPVLEATVREIEPWPAVQLRQSAEGLWAPLVKQSVRTVDDFVWHQGRLWIAETTKRPLPAEANFVNPEGEHYLWAYDPVLHQTELASRRLGSHTTIRALLSEGNHLWLGLEGAGVWRWNPGEEAAARRFTGEDGLLTMRLLQGQADKGALYFLGGEVGAPSAMRYDLGRNEWQGLGALRSGGMEFAIGQPRLRSLAVFGEWLGYADGEPTFYNRSTQTWKRFARPLAIPPGVQLSEPPRFYAASISADDSGFWLGRENLIRQLDPRAPEQQRDLAVPGVPLAMAHAGRWLWVLLEDRLVSDEEEKRLSFAGGKLAAGRATPPTRLALVDKETFTCVGVLPLPTPLMRKLVVADGRVWVGGSAVIEVTPRRAETAALAAGGQSPLDHPLQRAAARGDRTAVEKQLAAKMDPNQAAPGGWTALMTAVDAGQLEAADLLLKQGAKPNLQAVDGSTALLLAVRQGDIGLVKRLLQAGARAEPEGVTAVTGLERVYGPVIAAGALSVRPPDGVRPEWDALEGKPGLPTRMTWATPLQSAAAQGNEAVTRVLLEAGAKPDFEDYCGRTALLFAARQKQVGIIRQLLSRKGDPLRADAVGETPVMAAYRTGMDNSLLAEMLAGVSGETRRQAVSQLVFEAARTGRAADLSGLVSLGGDVNAALGGGETVLSVAIQNRQVAVAGWLIANGVVLPPEGAKGVSGDQRSELVDAVIKTGSSDVLAQLLDHGLPVDARINGQPLIAQAVEADQRELVALLKARGADLKARTSNGKQPLDLARSDEMRTLLAEASGGATRVPWHWPGNAGYWRGAQRVGRSVYVDGRMQVLRVSPEDQALLDACRTADLAAAKQAVAKGANVNCRDEEGTTALSHAVWKRNLALVRWLVEQGASVNFPTRAAHFPLNFAVDANAPEIVDYLLAEGAEINADGQGVTALVVAAQNGNLSLAQRLVAAGANVDLCCGGERTYRQNPLAAALQAGHGQLVDYLLSAGASPRVKFDYYYGTGTMEEVRHLNLTLLMYAAESGKVDLIKQMVALGQNARAVTREGEDALARAARFGRRDAVEFLLPLSASRGLAFQSAREGDHPEIVSLLERAGYQDAGN